MRALEKPMTKNPMLEVWRKRSLNMVESVEDKRMFNYISFTSPSSIVFNRTPWVGHEDVWIALLWTLGYSLHLVELTHTFLTKITLL